MTINKDKVGYTSLEIPITDRQLSILKVVLLTSIFIVVMSQVLNAHAQLEGEDYNFVYCFNEVTNSTDTYPEGTECGTNDKNEINELRDDNLEEQEEEQDEKDHQEESDEYDNRE